MDDLNISSQISGPSSVDNSEPTTQLPSQKQTIQDEISASAAMAALLYMMPAQTPSPISPTDTKIDPSQDMTQSQLLSQIAASYQNVQDQVVQTILDGWSKQIAEESERTREWIQSPQYQVWVETKFPNLDPNVVRNQAEVANEVGAVRGYAADAIRGSAQNSAVPGEMAAIAMGGLMIVGAAALTAGASIPVLASIGAGMAIVRSIGTSEVLTAQLSYIGGMLLAGIGARSSVNAMVGGLINGKMDTNSLAEEYTTRVYNMVTNKGFEAGILNRIVSQLPADKGLTADQMVTTVKIVMLSNAIAFLKKTEEGWLGPKMGELLQNGAELLNLPAGSIQAKLYNELSGQLQKLSPAQRDKIVGALDQYFESEPGLGDLTDINNTFAAIAMRAPSAEISDK